MPWSTLPVSLCALITQLADTCADHVHIACLLFPHAGLRLTDQLVATVARQHLPAVRFLVEELQKVKKAPDKHGGLSKLYAAVVTNQQVSSA